MNLNIGKRSRRVEVMKNTFPDKWIARRRRKNPVFTLKKKVIQLRFRNLSFSDFGSVCITIPNSCLNFNGETGIIWLWPKVRWSESPLVEYHSLKNFWGNSKSMFSWNSDTLARRRRKKLTIFGLLLRFPYVLRSFREKFLLKYF